MNSHKFWSLGALVCTIMAIYSGHKITSDKSTYTNQ